MIINLNNNNLLTGWYIYGDVIISRVFVYREHNCSWSL